MIIIMFLSSNGIGDMLMCGNRSATTDVENIVENDDSNTNIKFLRSIQRSFTFDEDDVSFLYEQRMNNNNNNSRNESFENLRTPPPPSPLQESSSNMQQWNEVYRCYNRIPLPLPPSTNQIQYMEDPLYLHNDELFVPSLEMTTEEEYENDEYENNEKNCYVTLQPRNADSIFKANHDDWEEDEEYFVEENNRSNDECQYCTPTTTSSSRKSYNNVEPSPKTVVVPTNIENQFHLHSFPW